MVLRDGLCWPEGAVQFLSGRLCRPHGNVTLVLSTSLQLAALLGMPGGLGEGGVEAAGFIVVSGLLWQVKEAVL